MRRSLATMLLVGVMAVSFGDSFMFLSFAAVEDDLTFEEWQEEEDVNGDSDDDVTGDYTLDYVYDYFKMRLLDDLQASPSEAEPEESEDPDLPVQGEIIPYAASDSEMAVFLSVPETEHFVNVLRYDCTVSGASYTLLFSPSYQDQLYVDSAGNLWNMGSNQITGRVLSDSFDPYADTGTLVYLAPCLGNNFATNHNYNSPNWFRRYYYSGDRLYYDDTYVRITVDQYHHTYLAGDLLTYVLIFLIGGCLICLWKRSSR